jgi:hypothetical protein
VRFEVPIPPTVINVDAPKISPDGKLLASTRPIATAGRRSGRPLNAIAAQPLPGTEGTRRPFWSPDSRYLGFMAEGKLKKIDVTGGPPTKICDAPTAVDGSWSREGVILLDGTGTDPILRVPAAGGSPVVAVKSEPSRKEVQVGWRSSCPMGAASSTWRSIRKPRTAPIVSGRSTPPRRSRSPRRQTMLAYAPPGYLLFAKDRTLVAQRFDAKSLKTLGRARPLAEQIGTDFVGLARFSVSRDGVLAYRTGESAIAWCGSTARVRNWGTCWTRGTTRIPVFSPNRDQLAFDVTDPRTGKADVWLRDLRAGVNSRFTFDARTMPIPPCGRRAATRSSTRANGKGAAGIYEKSTVGQGEEKLLARLEGLFFPTSILPGRLRGRLPDPRRGLQNGLRHHDPASH